MTRALGNRCKGPKAGRHLVVVGASREPVWLKQPPDHSSRPQVERTGGRAGWPPGENAWDSPAGCQTPVRRPCGSLSKRGQLR